MDRPKTLSDILKYVDQLSVEDRANLIIDLLEEIGATSQNPSLKIVMDLLYIADNNGVSSLGIVRRHWSSMQDFNRGTPPNPRVWDLGYHIHCSPGIQQQWASMVRLRFDNLVDMDAKFAFLSARVAKVAKQPDDKSLVKLRLRSHQGKVDYVAMANFVKDTYHLVRISEGRDQAK